MLRYRHARHGSRDSDSAPPPVAAQRALASAGVLCSCPSCASFRRPSLLLCHIACADRRMRGGSAARGCAWTASRIGSAHPPACAAHRPTALWTLGGSSVAPRWNAPWNELFALPAAAASMGPRRTSPPQHRPTLESSQPSSADSLEQTRETKTKEQAQHHRQLNTHRLAMLRCTDSARMHACMSDDSGADAGSGAAPSSFPRASPAANLPASLLCLTCSFLTSPRPVNPAAPYSINAAPRLSAHAWLLLVGTRVCRSWRVAVPRSEAFNNESIMRVSLLTAEAQTEQAQSRHYTGLYSLLQPRASWVRTHLQHLVLAIPTLPGKGQGGLRHQQRRAAGHIFPSDDPPPSLQALLGEVRWPALRSIMIVGSSSAESALHLQSDRTLHALWHTITEHSTMLFPKLRCIEFRSVSFTASLLTLRPGAVQASTSCCSQSAFKLLAPCAQLDRLSLVQVYAEPDFGYDLARMQHLRDLHVFSTHIEGIKSLQLRSLTRAHAESRPARTCIFINEALRMPHPLQELCIQGPLSAEAMRALCFGRAANTAIDETRAFAAATGSTADSVPAHSSSLCTLKLQWSYSRPYSSSLRADPIVFVPEECWAAFDAQRFLQTHPHLTHLSLLQRTYANQLDAAMHLLQMVQPLLGQLRLLQIHCDTDGMASYALGKPKNVEKQARAVAQLQAEFRRLQGSEPTGARLEVVPQQ